VNEYLADAKARELSEATLYKLELLFRKQLRVWCHREGYTLLRELILKRFARFDDMEGRAYGQEENRSG
jgi:hypothetical protein